MLTWKKQLPDKEGWWWYRCYDIDSNEVPHVEKGVLLVSKLSPNAVPLLSDRSRYDPNELYVFWYNSFILLKSTPTQYSFFEDFEWAGPIEEPTGSEK